MSHTKFQHLMCVGSYDPLPSTFGPAIKTVKVKEPEVTVKNGFTLVDGKVVSYDPFKDPKQCLKLVKAATAKVVDDAYDKLAFRPYNYIYKVPLSIQKEDPSEQVLTFHASKTRFQKSKNVEYQGNHTTLPGGHQHDEIAQHSVAGLDPSGKLSFPVEQPAGTFSLDLKRHASMCRLLVRKTLWNMPHDGRMAQAVVYLQQALLKDLNSEIDSYLSSRAAHAPDNRSEETGFISALVHATRNNAAADREAFLKELAEEPNFSLLQEIHKQESARVAEHVSAYANIWTSESAVNDRRHVNWRDTCERGGNLVASASLGEELFHSVHTDKAAYLSEAASTRPLDLRIHWYMDGKLVHIGDTYCPTTIGRVSFSWGPRD